MVLRERGGAFEFGACFVAAAGASKEVGAYRRHEMIALERRYVRELVDFTWRMEKPAITRRPLRNPRPERYASSCCVGALP
jgi:hypothetical protein